MHAELDDLIRILTEQRDRQAALVELSERKTAVITAGDTAGLNGIVEQEKAELARVKAVEALQGQCVQRLAALMKMPAGKLHMSLIIERADGGQKERLAELRGELTGLIDKQLKANEINMRLLQMNLDYAQFLLNAASNQQTGATYGSSGGVQKAAGGQKRLLDRKV